MAKRKHPKNPGMTKAERAMREVIMSGIPTPEILDGLLEIVSDQAAVYRQIKTWVTKNAGRFRSPNPDRLTNPF